MNMKNLLKGVDYKGLAIRHCEKAVIVVVTAMLVGFLMSGVNKAMRRSDISADRIAELADKLTTNVRNSRWESSDDSKTVTNPPFDEDIKKLMTGVDSKEFKLSAPYFFNFVDFGGILRQKPDIFSPYNPIAFPDKGALSLYKTDAKGNYLFEEKVIRAVPKKKAPKKDEDPKKKSKAAPKSGLARGGKGGSGGMPGMGGPAGGDMADGYEGMMSGRMGSGMSSMGMGMGMGAEMGDDSDSDSDDSDSDSDVLMGNLGLSQAKKSGGSIRQKLSKQEDDDQFADEQPAGKAGGAPAGPGAKADPKAPVTRKVEAEEIRGIRWAVITALFPHREQVQEYLNKLHADDPPVYKMVMVERREVQSDGSLSEWAPLDLKKETEIVRVIPKKRRTPELSDFIAAKAIFEGLVMPLPELAVGKWTAHNQRAAFEAAKNATQVTGRGTDDGGMTDSEGEEASEAELNQGLFGSGGMTPQSGGVQGMGAGGPGMVGGQGGMTSGGVGMGMAGMAGMGMAGMAGGRGMPSMGKGGGAYGPGSNQFARGDQSGQGTAKASAQRSNAEIVQIRFIDYTVEPEHTYQYRLKVVVENPNVIATTNKDGKVTYTPRWDIISEDVVKDVVKDETLTTLTSDDWSEPTLPVYVPADTEYYVLERVKTREEAKIQVHKWLADLGDWQFSDFYIKPGDPIGAEVRDYPLVDLEDKLKKIPRFDFSTQDLLLDVTGGDRKMTFLIDGAEVTITESLPTEIFVVDRLGDLLTRNQDFDKYNAERKDRETQIKTLREEAEKETTKKSGTPKTETGGSEGFDERVPSRKSGS